MSTSRDRSAIGAAFVALLATLAMLSPLATDTYLPALGAVRADLNATAAQVQQTLGAYMLGLSIMALWHGSVSDAVGRRPVILAGGAVYAMAALGCALATDVRALIAFRLLQGLAGGAGMIIVGVIVRDRVEGAAAQRLLSRVMVLFAVAPGIAPIIGGALFAAFGWRSVFWFLFATGAAVWLWALLALPETLPPHQRRSLHPVHLLRGYFAVLRNPAFHALTAAAAFSFQAFFQYVGAAYPLLVVHLRLAETQFAVLFVPIVAGFMIGSTVSGRIAGKWSAGRTAATAFSLMLGAAGFNVAYHAGWPPAPLPSIAPIFLATIGLSMLVPRIQLLVLDLFPATRGLAASCQASAQLLVSTVSVGFVSLALSGSALTLALGQLAWVLAAVAAWSAYLLLVRRATLPA